MRSHIHSGMHLSLRLTYNAEQKFNLTYWSTDFHGESADCLRGSKKSVIHLIDITGSWWKKWARHGKGERIHSSHTILCCSGLLATGHSIFSLLRWGWTVSGGAYGLEGKVHCSRPANVYHLLAFRTYALCGSHPQPGRETQTINGGQMVEGGEWGIGRRTGMWISGS